MALAGFRVAPNGLSCARDSTSPRVIVIRRLLCVLRNGGHTWVPYRGPDRFARRCWLCGYVKGGWEIAPARLKVRA